MTENGEHVARCDACGQKKSNHKGDLERHAVTITHIEAMSLYRDKLQQEASMAQFTLPLNNKITSLELKVSILVWEKPMSVSSEESILDVVEKEASTNVSCTTKLAMVCTLWNHTKGKLKSDVVDVVETSYGAALGLTSVLCERLEKRGIPFANFVGFSADTCNIMFGRLHSV
ncbi:hypothetical protein OUZ56_024091 [Daphnia magna]|uniref:C2H2-type domain-containing protein n=1 Tax=Daphnia magna TaxID=35525 RepID=A0ABR0B0T5_9CRUS|nr:hypothetical protein OUZ56_024091 [Daphnia magna]